MGNGLWRHDGTGIELCEVEEVGDGEREPSVELRASDEALATLGVEEALELADALRAWARSNASAPAVPEGAYFQVYYRCEYLDDDGAPVPLDGLGEADDEGAYTWDEETLEAARERVRQIGESLSAAYEERRGEPWSPEVEESARAWVSLFRMPDDSRLWKGFSYELEDLDDAALLEHVE